MECGLGASQMQVNSVLRPTISRVLALNGSRRCAAADLNIQLFEYAAEKPVLCQARQIFLLNRKSEKQKDKGVGFRWRNR
jgi:hypothetical protein